MKTSEAVNDIAAALSKAQGAMKPAIKDSLNPAFRSKYADLAANVEAARGPLADNDLAVLQEPTLVDKGVSVATTILHKSGQWIQFDPMTVPLAKSDAHGVGSATSYARRYALGAVLGLVAEDDDGNAAVTDKPAQTQQAQHIAPAGFKAWWTKLEAAADKGQAALRAEWGQGAIALRDYVAAAKAGEWEAIKAKAAAVKVSA